MSHILKNKFLNFASFILFLLAWIVPLTFAQEHMGKGRVDCTLVGHFFFCPPGRSDKASFVSEAGLFDPAGNKRCFV